MTRPEYSGNRDLSYSEWHRLYLPSKCYVMNLDWIEYREEWVSQELNKVAKAKKPKIVALIEDKDDRAGKLQEWKKEVMLQISQALNVPTYLVYHNMCRRYDHRQLWKFEVVNLLTNATTIMNEPEYRNFIENL